MSTKNITKMPSNKKIIKMCHLYNRQNGDASKPTNAEDKEFYVSFWKKQKLNKNYCGKIGLHTIVDYYVEHTKNSTSRELQEKYYKKYGLV